MIRGSPCLSDSPLIKQPSSRGVNLHDDHGRCAGLDPASRAMPRFIHAEHSDIVEDQGRPCACCTTSRWPLWRSSVPLSSVINHRKFPRQKVIRMSVGANCPLHVFYVVMQTLRMMIFHRGMSSDSRDFVRSRTIIFSKPVRTHGGSFSNICESPLCSRVCARNPYFEDTFVIGSDLLTQVFNAGLDVTF